MVRPAGLGPGEPLGAWPAWLTTRGPPGLLRPECLSGLLQHHHRERPLWHHGCHVLQGHQDLHRGECSLSLMTQWPLRDPWAASQQGVSPAAEDGAEAGGQAPCGDPEGCGPPRGLHHAGGGPVPGGGGQHRHHRHLGQEDHRLYQAGPLLQGAWPPSPTWPSRHVVGSAAALPPERPW